MSAKVDAPPGGPWKQAWVERSSSRSPYGGRNLGSRTTTTVDLRLTGNGRDERFVLSENGEIPTDAKVEIVFAPDGHALALRKVGDPAYGYVALDAGDAPLFCPHWTFGATGDPWRGAPTTRDLAIDILSAGPASGHHAEGVTSREVIPAADYACAHREAAIMMAMVRLAREGAPLPGPDLALPCLVDAARTHAEVRDGLLAAAIGNKGTDRANARKWTARVLAQLGDERAQEALATLLSDEMAIASEHLEERWHEALPEIAHALTLVTEARRAASDPAIRIASLPSPATRASRRRTATPCRRRPGTRSPPSKATRWLDRRRRSPQPSSRRSSLRARTPRARAIAAGSSPGRWRSPRTRAVPRPPPPYRRSSPRRPTSARAAVPAHPTAS
ncbi:MAG: hypothetical protein U0166_04360 [Acidobacteriota bacterium]